MVRDPVCAFPWQPISFIRQQMLANAFSYLPVFGNRSTSSSPDPKWCLVSDFQVAEYLRSDPNKRKERLAKTLQDAWDAQELEPESAECCSPDMDIQEALKLSKGRPLIITHTARPDKILGILTPFDVL